MLQDRKKYHYHNTEPLPSYNKVTGLSFIDWKAEEKVKRSPRVTSLQTQFVCVCMVGWGWELQWNVI